MSPSRCSACGHDHGPWITSLALASPDDLLDPSPADRARIVRGDDCVHLGEERYFLRGNLSLALDDPSGHVIVWSLWAEVDRSTYKRSLALWVDPRRTREATYPARLANDLPGIAPLGRAPVTLETPPPGQRLRIALVSSPHPLAAGARIPARLACLWTRLADS